MDPLSYGYNRATPTYAYMNASSITTSLIDIVSKNGNFLLDVGPQANGTIIDVEQTNFREGGVWISYILLRDSRSNYFLGSASIFSRVTCFAVG
jgi:hypothetical protein